MPSYLDMALIQLLGIDAPVLGAEGPRRRGQDDAPFLTVLLRLVHLRHGRAAGGVQARGLGAHVAQEDLTG